MEGNYGTGEGEINYMELQVGGLYMFILDIEEEENKGIENRLRKNNFNKVGNFHTWQNLTLLDSVDELGKQYIFIKDKLIENEPFLVLESFVYGIWKVYRIIQGQGSGTVIGYCSIYSYNEEQIRSNKKSGKASFRKYDIYEFAADGL